MRIASYNSSMINTLPPSHKKKNDCSFGMIYDREYGHGINLVGDGINYKNVPIKNYTKLIRGIKVFKELPQYLKETYPNGATIYDYACSAGHEASSIAISLFNELPQSEAKKFMPILAFDNNKRILKTAQNHTLKLAHSEIVELNQFKNTNASDFLLPARASSDGQKMYKMTNKLTDNIQFNYGDLFKDLKNDKLSKEPCVLFFRNAWQFLTKDGAESLAKSLFEKLPSGSTIIIGEKDIEEQSANIILKNAGFKQMQATKAVNPNEKSMRDRFNAIREGESLSTFCFKKP